MLSHHFEQGLIGRIQGTIRRRNTNTKFDVKAMAQIDVAQFAPLVGECPQALV